MYVRCVGKSYQLFNTGSNSVCVVIPFILDVRLVDVPAGVTQEEGHTGFLTHLPCAVLAREKDPAVPFPRRPRSRILCTNDLIVLHLLGIFFFFFIFIFFCEEKSQFV